MRFFLLSLLLFMAAKSQALDVNIRPSSGTATDLFFSDMTNTTPVPPSDSFVIKANVSCYSTNLRSNTNPVSPSGIIRMGLEFNTGSSITLLFPARLIIGQTYQTMDEFDNLVTRTYTPASLPVIDSTDPSQSIQAELNNVLLSAVGTASQNMVMFNVPKAVQTIAIGPDGSFDVKQRAGLLHRIHYAQDLSSTHGKPPPAFVKNEIPDWPIQSFFSKLMRPLDVFSRTFSGAHAGGGGDGGGDGGGGDGGGDGGDGGSVVSAWDETAFEQPTPLTSNEDLGWFKDTWRFKHWAASGFAMNDMNSPYRYMGRDGPVTAQSEYTWSSDFTTLNVNVSFPGQFGFCGGWFSPLMLFFNDKRPQFSAVNNFKMSSYASHTYWPEKSASGYFLVIDKNQDGIINDVTEMFGSEEDGNGFEVLAQFDENGDGLINRLDPIYSQLQLWKDSTATGRTLAKDLKSLAAAGVTQIDLRYQKNEFQKIGRRAELRETSKFLFVKDGRTHQGAVIDVWFASPQ